MCSIGIKAGLFASWMMYASRTERTNANLFAKSCPFPFGGEYRTKKSVALFVKELLAPINSGLLNPASTQTITEFVERIYFPEFVNRQLRASTQKQYRDTWSICLKGRMGKLTLRDFRTVHGEQLLANIARQTNLGRNSLRHLKSFLSGVFKQAKRLGILDGPNPMQDVSIPKAPEPEETYSYTLDDVKMFLSMLEEPGRTVVLTAALTGLRKGEIRGLRWADFDGKELFVRRSFWNKVESEPKTRKSRAPVPVVKQLVDALELHRQRMGILAQPDLPIFQAGNGQPLDLNNLARRVIAPVCPNWRGWHAFRRGLATNLHALGIPDKEIQAILRHSNVGLTMNVYVKSVSESQTAAMDAFSEKLESCNV